MNLSDLEDSQRWHQITLEHQDIPSLLARVMTLPDTDVRQARVAWLLFRTGRVGAAERAVTGRVHPLAQAMHAGARLDLAAALPLPADRYDRYQEIAGLDPLLPPGHPEAQARLDFVRGQALGELGQISEGRALLFAAARQLRGLSLSTANAEKALARLEPSANERIERSRLALAHALRDGNLALAAAARRDILEAATFDLNYAVIEQIAPELDESHESESLLRSTAFLRGHRDLPLPEEVGAARTLAGLVRLFAKVECALFYDWSFEPKQAVAHAQQALNLSEGFNAAGAHRHATRMLRARAEMLLNNYTQARTLLSEEPSHPRMRAHVHIMRCELLMHERRFEEGRHEARQAGSLLLELPRPQRGPALDVAARIAPNAVRLMTRLNPDVPTSSRVHLIDETVGKNRKLLTAHRRFLTEHPNVAIAYSWLLTPALPRSGEQ